MITLKEFNRLDDHQKFNELLNGIYLEMRFEDGLLVQLYTLNDYYAEVYYNHINNEVIKIVGFRSNEILANSFVFDQL